MYKALASPVMGYSCSADNVLFFIPALSQALAVQGFKTDLASGLDAVLSELDGDMDDAAFHSSASARPVKSGTVTSGRKGVSS